MKILGVDPGPEKTALVLWDSQEEKILQAAILPNPEALTLFRSLPLDCQAVAIETIGHYGSGMPAGKEVFNTCVFIGELKEACFPHFTAHLVERRAVKLLDDIIPPAARLHGAEKAEGKPEGFGTILTPEAGIPKMGTSNPLGLLQSA